MRTFREARQQLAQYRIRLERDVRAGIIAAPVGASADRGLGSILTMLESARIEIEAAGPGPHQEADFVEAFLATATGLGLSVVHAARGALESREIERRAAPVLAEGRTLLEHLRMRIARAA